MQPLNLTDFVCGFSLLLKVSELAVNLLTSWYELFFHSHSVRVKDTTTKVRVSPGLWA